MKIKVEPLFPTGNYLNCRIGIEIDIPDDGDMVAEINMQWDNLIAIHMKRYPHLYKDGKPLYEFYKGEEQPIKEIQVGEISDSTQASLNEINKCTTLDELKHCWIMSKGNLTLSAAYKQKEKDLQNAK